ncbi:MAG: TRL-like family protein [Treponema sp.]|jgi:hypothetical protein|nr:TRL-like family protein [Treponema sp.]
MKKILFLTVLVVALVLVGCASTSPWGVTDNSVGSKIGEATQTTWFWVFTTGDAGIITAAQNGGVQKIGAVDIRLENYIIFNTTTTVVAGD